MIVFNDAEEASGEDLSAQKVTVQRQREELLEHLEQASAIEEVELPPATPLPSLLVEGSERGLAECLNAPSVKEVLTISGDIPMKGL